MWPVLVEQFNCGFLRNDAGGEVELITSFLHLFWAILGVFTFIRKLLITAFMTNLDPVNPASIY